MITEHQISEHLRQLRERIDEHGYTMLGVLPEPDAPGYTYTLGMQATWGHPDLIMFGVPYEVAAQLLPEIALRVKAGEQFADGAVLQRVANMPLCVRGADARVREYVSERMSGGAYDYLQVVFPDPQGRFPWHLQYDRAFSAAQPLLFPTASS